MRTLQFIAVNEVRGLASVWLWRHTDPTPVVAVLTAATGLAMLWALVWRDLVKPELIARHQAQLLGAARPSPARTSGWLRPRAPRAPVRIDWWAFLGISLMAASAASVFATIVWVVRL